MESLIKLICLQKLNHESALIELAVYPMEVGTLSSSATTTSNNYPRLVEQLTRLMIETVPPPNSTDAIPNNVPNINQSKIL